MLRSLAYAALSLLPFSAMAESQVERPAHETLLSDGDFEIRRYGAIIAAEVSVPASTAPDAASRGFRPLAGYIFGDNERRRKINMTAPVTAAPASDRIAMTAPVTATTGADGWKVRFIMPVEWSMDTLPRPKNESVQLVEIPERLMATYRYVGRRDADAFEAASAKLADWIEAKGYEATGPVSWAGYNGPATPQHKRVYEAMMPVQPLAND